MDAQEQGTWVPEWTLGDRLRKAREVAGLEQGELAGRMGVARGTVHNYESDATTKVKRPYLREWAHVTGVSLHWLETGEAGSDNGPGLKVVHRQGLEPRTRWLGVGSVAA